MSTPPHLPSDAIPTQFTESFDSSQIQTVRIYPPIGIARVGNSKNEWFYGPEVPGRFDEPEGGFKDAEGAVKRQAARFRVYAFDARGQVLGEVKESHGFHIQWSFEVANQKPAWYTFAGSQDSRPFKEGNSTLRNPDVQPDLPPVKRDKLIVTSGIQTLSGSNARPLPLVGQFYGSKSEPTPISLGEARTDDHGRLVVLAGSGFSHSITDKDEPYPLIMTDFDSPDWIDDTSDGWISVQVVDRRLGETFTSPNQARVIGTTPKFANGIYAPTTLYDLMEEVYEREKRAKEGDKYDVGRVGWYQHIWPLLERPPLLSWCNGQANGGHGPNGEGNFFNEKWQRDLSDPSPKSEPIRKAVLGRMRLPATNEKYDSARAGQAYPYFMPWLSGDGGRTTAGDPSTFASVTELQYDRLVKWSKGEFVKDPRPPPPPPPSVEDLKLSHQPAALTKAALEATIGAPLYPGIEMSWNAELSETYQLDVPFTIREDVLAGDLTKYLSLPWQSDFYMCRSYWWPSARPDAIVPEADYDKAKQSLAPANVAKALDRRVPWERGIHLNYTDEFGDQPLFANTDMARRWHLLGFIVQRPSGGPEPIFVETQRGDLHKDSLLSDIVKKPQPVLVNSETQQSDLDKPRQKALVVDSETRLGDLYKKTPPKQSPTHGGIKLPKPESGNHPIRTIDSLREHLQAAIAVELSTIPLYLFGMYSIKTPAAFVNDPRYYDPIAGAVRGVVAEEMLHLSLAGNILLAVGGKPKLYDPSIIPQYPMLMLGRVPDLELNLRMMSKENLQTYVDVESPAAKCAQAEADDYHTLGQFYKAIKSGLKYLDHKEKDLFHSESAPYQFSPGLGYQPQVRDAGGSVVVVDLATADKAIDIIVDQGEGNPGPYDDPDKLEKDHYDVFRDLQQGTTTWDLYPVRTNPTTFGYWREDKRIYQVSLTFDAAYCFLLLTIEKLWTIKSDDERHKLVLGNMFGIMMGVLAPLAKFLVQQPLMGGRVAAPCFGYYQFEKGSALKQLQSEMQNAINAYVGVTAETSDQVPVTNYGPMLEMLLPIQTSVNRLLDLDSWEKLEQAAVKKELGIHSCGAKGFARGF